MQFPRPLRLALQRVLAAVFIAAFGPSAVFSQTLILKRADFNENTMSRGGLVSELRGNVHFVYGDAEISADFTRWQRRQGTAHFSGDVKIVRPHQTLTCRKMTYDRNGKKVVVGGNVDFLDHERNMRMTGERGTYYLDKGDIVVDLNPRLMRYDTTDGDTLVIVAKRMRYNDSLRTADAFDDVVMTKGSMRGVGGVAHFLPDDYRVLLRRDPHLYYDTHHLSGDSIDLFFVDELLRGIAVMRKAEGVYHEFDPKDTIVTVISGDSLYMDITETGALDTIWVYRDAKSVYYSMRNAEQKNTAEGKRMVLEFDEAGEARLLRIEGNAKSVYFVQGDANGDGGRNKASGDVIYVTFRDGRAAYLRMSGGVRGQYSTSR